MRILSFLLALALVAASGCSQPEATPDGTDPDPGGSGNQTAPPSDPAAGDNSTSEPGNQTSEPDNQAPIANLTADVLGGTTPLEVRFTINATDADDDALTWNLTVDGVEIANGTTLPAEASHVFTEAGAFRVVATVSDGSSNGTANVTIETQVATLAVQDERVQWVGGNGGCGAEYPFWEFGTPAAGVTHGEFAVDPATVGQTWTATFSFTADSGLITMLGVGFFDAAGDIVSGGSFAFLPEDTVSGVVPTGAAMALVYDCGAIGGSAHYQTDGVLAV